MDQSSKQKITTEDLPKGIPNDWKEIVWLYNKIDYKFWEESWNEKD